MGADDFEASQEMAEELYDVFHKLVKTNSKFCKTDYIPFLNGSRILIGEEILHSFNPNNSGLNSNITSDAIRELALKKIDKNGKMILESLQADNLRLTEKEIAFSLYDCSKQECSDAYADTEEQWVL